MASTAIARTPSLRPKHRAAPRAANKPSIVFVSLNSWPFAPAAAVLSMNGTGSDGVDGTTAGNLPDLIRDAKDSPSHPRPLTIFDVWGSVDRSHLRVAYQGLPVAYSEAAVAKAYPNCEAVPCKLLENTFDDVESRLVDRAVRTHIVDCEASMADLNAQKCT